MSEKNLNTWSEEKVKNSYNTKFLYEGWGHRKETEKVLTSKGSNSKDIERTYNPFAVASGTSSLEEIEEENSDNNISSKSHKQPSVKQDLDDINIPPYSKAAGCLLRLRRYVRNIFHSERETKYQEHLGDVGDA